MASIVTYKSSELQRQFSGRPKWLKFLPFDMAIDHEQEIRRRIKGAMRAHQDSKGWSQREMADFLKISLKNYEVYLKPERGVPLGLISRFCNYTDTDINWVMCITKKKSKPTQPDLTTSEH